MKLNNKGITLVEIIVSVALISIVLVFLFTLLIQVNNENADNEVKTSYLVNQSSFIKQIEEDFLDYQLTLGKLCEVSDIESLSLSRLLGTIDANSSSDTHNIKCIKFEFEFSNPGYLFLYKRSDVTTTDETDYDTILSYYRFDSTDSDKDFKQSAELEDFNWNENKYEITVSSETDFFKNYSLPIIGPDYNDYSINLSYISNS